MELIAVRPDRQGRGRGKGLLKHVEATLSERGKGVLLVETSGKPQFEGVRAFYLKCGCEREVRIWDFHEAGDDKIAFRKAL